MLRLSTSRPQNVVPQCAQYELLCVLYCTAADEP